MSARREDLAVSRGSLAPTHMSASDEHVGGLMGPSRRPEVVAREVDVTTTNLSILKTNKARACRALECQPGDLLEYLPDEDPEVA